VALFIHSNGGSGTVPWRIVSLIREYTKNFAVLVPHHAFSAATLVALGADKIVMHKMGCLGPIDPSVANAFNPTHPQNPAQLVPISVEDVSAYFTLIKEDIGVQHEDELIQAVIALTEKIHPLALGNVQRSHKQSRMIARKLLRQHMPEAEREHEIDKLIENLKSNLYYHGHPINREEARTDLKLKVEDADNKLEAVLWALYELFASELNLTERFNAAHELDIRQPPAPPTPPVPTTQQIVAQMQQLAAAGIGLGAGLTEQQFVNLAVAMLPHISGSTPPLSGNKVRLERVRGAYLQTVDASHVFLTDLTFERATANTPTGPQDLMKQEVLWQRWELET
jgi:Serine dehydrogenase proteinase